MISLGILVFFVVIGSFCGTNIDVFEELVLSDKIGSDDELIFSHDCQGYIFTGISEDVGIDSNMKIISLGEDGEIIWKSSLDLTDSGEFSSLGSVENVDGIFSMGSVNLEGKDYLALIHMDSGNGEVIQKFLYLNSSSGDGIAYSSVNSGTIVGVGGIESFSSVSEGMIVSFSTDPVELLFQKSIVLDGNNTLCSRVVANETDHFVIGGTIGGSTSVGVFIHSVLYDGSTEYSFEVFDESVNMTVESMYISQDDISSVLVSGSYDNTPMVLKIRVDDSTSSSVEWGYVMPSYFTGSATSVVQTSDSNIIVTMNNGTIMSFDQEYGTILWTSYISSRDYQHLTLDSTCPDHLLISGMLEDDFYVAKVDEDVMSSMCSGGIELLISDGNLTSIVEQLEVITIEFIETDLEFMVSNETDFFVVEASPTVSLDVLCTTCDLNWYHGNDGVACNITHCNGFFSNETASCGSHGECLEPEYCDCSTNWYGQDVCNITFCNGYFSNETDSCGEHGTCLEHEYCGCDTNWYGQDICNITICNNYFSNQSESCGIHGSCMEYEYCDCDTNWFGQDTCNITDCYGYFSNETEYVCFGNGDCIAPDLCQCTAENWYGDKCDITHCNRYFSNTTDSCGVHGECLAPEYCDCDTDWFGEDWCNITICNGYFSNETLSCGEKGVCVMPELCACQTNWYAIDGTCNITHCNGYFSNETESCGIHGTCLETEYCGCDTNWYGQDICNITLCNNHFSNETESCGEHGTCTSFENCVCDTNWFGRDTCNVTVCEGVFSNDTSGKVCNGYGVCLAPDACQCTNQLWYGTNCDITMCNGYFSNETSSCGEGGECLDPEYCECDPGWYGVEWCNVTICFGVYSNDTFLTPNMSACGEFGDCVDLDHCECYPHHYGTFCNITTCFGNLDNETDVVCYGHGDCLSFDNCDCEEDEYYYGPACNVTICFDIFSNDSDSSLVCNNGLCTEFDQCTCYDHYFGVHCNVTECYGYLSNNTEEVCHGHGTCTDYNTCQCVFGGGFFGENCNLTDCYGLLMNDSDVCSGKGSCIEDLVGDDNWCACDPYYYEMECNVTECFGYFSNETDRVCNNHGTCWPWETCSCHGPYFGMDCNITTCYGVYSNDSMTCAGHGTCSPVDTCRCREDYFGVNCNLTTCHDLYTNESGSCSDHGVCLVKDECSCDTYYYGEYCNVTECGGGILSNLSESCGDWGTCVLYEECDCLYGYFGELCEIPSCNGTLANESSVCNHQNGTCDDYNHCNCSSGYTGDTCELWMCEGIPHIWTEYVCHGHGVCGRSEFCECDEGWTEEYCGVPVCYGLKGTNNESCSGHGECLDFNDCQCDDFWDGDECEFAECYGVYADKTDLVCSGHGNCTDVDVCSCGGDYYGDNCDLWDCDGKLMNDTYVCFGHGTCASPETCECDQHYYTPLEFCENYDCGGIPWYEESSCSLNGTCDSHNNCTCDAGYFGDDCELWECDGYLFDDYERACYGIDHGECISPDRCRCEDGYYDADPDWCEYYDCDGSRMDHPSVCNYRNGTCVSPDHCACHEGYYGENCEVAMCGGYLSNDTLNVCSNRGTCYSLEFCQCDEVDLWGGEACQYPKCFLILDDGRATETICNGHGDCVLPNDCACDEHLGFFGIECKEELILVDGDSVQINLNLEDDDLLPNVTIPFRFPRDYYDVYSRRVERLSFVCEERIENVEDVLGNSLICEYECDDEYCHTISIVVDGNPLTDDIGGTLFVHGTRQNLTVQMMSTDELVPLFVDGECYRKGAFGESCNHFLCFGIPSYDTNIVCNGRGNCVGEDNCACDEEIAWGSMCETLFVEEIKESSNGGAVAASVIFSILFAIVLCCCVTIVSIICIICVILNLSAGGLTLFFVSRKEKGEKKKDPNTGEPDIVDPYIQSTRSPRSPTGPDMQFPDGMELQDVLPRVDSDDDSDEIRGSSGSDIEKTYRIPPNSGRLDLGRASGIPIGRKDFHVPNLRPSGDYFNVVYFNPRPFPMYNFTNTCYFNSALQVLLRSKKFRHYIRMNKGRDQVSKFLYSLIRRDTTQKIRMKNLRTFHGWCCRKGVANAHMEQDDPGKLINNLMGMLKDIPDFMTWTTINIEMCKAPDCGEMETEYSDEEDTERSAVLKVGKDTRSFTNFFERVSTVGGGNVTDPFDQCSECQAPTLIYTALKENVPTTALLRVDRGREIAAPFKIDPYIIIPTFNGQFCVLRLVACSMHEGGSFASGHYTALVRCSPNHWWHCDDNRRPKKISTEEVFGRRLNTQNRGTRCVVALYEMEIVFNDRRDADLWEELERKRHTQCWKGEFNLPKKPRKKKTQPKPKPKPKQKPKPKPKPSSPKPKPRTTRTRTKPSTRTRTRTRPNPRLEEVDQFPHVNPLDQSSPSSESASGSSDETSDDFVL